MENPKLETRVDLEEPGVRNKLSVLSQVAGGIAHELRTPLGVIRNSVYFLAMQLENQDEDIRKHCRIIEEEIVRADKIIGMFLDMTKAREPFYTKLDMVDLTRNLIDTRRVVISSGIKFISPEYPVMAVADRVQIEQALTNVILNADQSMPGSGEIIVRFACDGPDCVIEVEDSGCGIPEGNIQRIFEPLFTTKAKGIGLGLSITRSILAMNHGSISARSRVGKGSIFTVVLKKAPDAG